MNATVQAAVQALSTKIDDMAFRCRSLENTTCASQEEFTRVVNELLDLQTKQAALAARKAMLETYGDLLESTPASSGRARAAWTLSSDGSAHSPEPFPDPETYDAGRVEAAVTDNLQGLPTDEFADLYLANELDYLPLLEAGLSDQAAGFVAAAEAELAARLQAMEKQS